MNDAATPVPPVDILLIGNVTRDLIDEHDFEHYRLGGTVTFAAVVADRLGRRPTVITRAAPETDLSAMPASAQVHVLPSATTTTFANIYTPHGRVQYCYTPAPPISAADIPAALRAPDIALLGPIANEITGDVPAVFAESTVIAAVPQGWMRRLDERGRVHSKQWESAREILPHLDALILSLEDIDYEWERLAAAFNYVPLIVVTEYRDELTRTITETVERWDGPETARRVELAAGRDLQFIRINGAVVGALAGLAIHAVGVFLG